MHNDLQINHNNLGLDESYKTYSNVLNRSVRTAKSAFYYRVLSENECDSKKVWNTSNELVYNNKRSRLGPL